MPNEPTLSTTAKTLEELGLAKNEAILYEILLKTPAATIPYLVKNSPFSRTLLYYLLGNLESYGLLTVEGRGTGDGKKTTYIAEPPEKIAEMIGDREKEFHKQKDLLHNVMGDLYSTYRLAHNKPGVKFFEGEEGIREVLADSLTSNTIIYTYADIEAIVKYIDAINQEYVKKRDHLGLKKEAIIVDSPFARNYLKEYHRDTTDIKFIKGDVHPFQNVMQIYDGKISYLTLEGDTMIGVIISDPVIYRMHRSLFEFTWAKLPTFAEWRSQYTIE